MLMSNKSDLGVVKTKRTVEAVKRKAPNGAATAAAPNAARVRLAEAAAKVPEIAIAEPKRGRGRPKGSTVKLKPGLPGHANLRSKLKEQKQIFVQEQILQVAAELIAVGGFRAVTIDDISATLGFSKTVIYYYLTSKNDILWRIFCRIYDTYFEALKKITEMDADPDKKMKEIVRLHATNVMTYRAWTAISMREEAELDESQHKQIVKLKRDYDSAIEDIYQDGIARGIFVDIPPHIAVNALMGACNSLYTWYNPAGALSVSEIADHYANLLTNGYRVREGAA
jgi:TetR/AcrR family transcriptional regulator, cholesterol catabolism regulator